MKFFKKCKDGGDLSIVDAYVLIEIKSLFSIMLLKFNKGSRENYHSHAFNAISIYLTGHVDELVIEGNDVCRVCREGFQVKYTPRTLLHKVQAFKASWCLTFRGRWHDTWQEYDGIKDEIITLTHGRKILDIKPREVHNDIRS